jgi:D-alanine-D-alanine ligase
MTIGLTFDLRSHYLEAGFSMEDAAEFDSQETVDSLVETIEGLGYRVDRIGHLQELVKRLAGGAQWDLVFNIAEGVSGFSREAQIPLLLEAYGIPCTFADPLVLSICLHKGIAKRLFRDLHIPTAPFCIVDHQSAFCHVPLSFPVFVKPVAEGTGKGINNGSLIQTPGELMNQCQYLLDRFQQPVLIEEYLPGREFTVGIIGTGGDAQVIGALEVVLKENAEQGGYSYINKEECEHRVIYQLAEDNSSDMAASYALRAWKEIGCRDAGRVDVKLDGKGIPCIMEINPLAGLHPTHSDLPILCSMKGIPYNELIQRIIESALERVNRKVFPSVPAM